MGISTSIMSPSLSNPISPPAAASGERIVVCDGKGTDYVCHLLRSGDKEAGADSISFFDCERSV